MKDEQPVKRGEMSVRAAGKRGGDTTARVHGAEFYQRIGAAGGARVKALIERGRQVEEKKP